jgi:hypothetical protein
MLLLSTLHIAHHTTKRALSFPREYLGREEARSISVAPLATLPPPRSNGYSSKGDNLKKKLEGGTIDIKWEAKDCGGPNKRPSVTSSGSTPSHLSSSFLTAKPSFLLPSLELTNRTEGGEGPHGQKGPQNTN